MFRCIAFALLALVPGIVIAEAEAEPEAGVEPFPVLLLVPESGAVYSDFADGFSACFGTKESPVSFYRIKTIKQVQTRPELLEGHRVVAVGTKSSEFMHFYGNGLPFVSALVPESFARQLLESGEKGSGVASLFFLDQPLNRRLSLIRTLLPAAEKLSAVLGKESAHLKEAITQEASRLGFTVESFVVKSGEELPKLSAGLFDTSDGLFLVYDPILTSPTVIRFLLYSAYQKQVPVFGYSDGYVKAGALAAVYSTSEGLGCQLGEHLTENPEHPPFTVAASNRQPPKIFYPDYYRYAVNPSVANSLGIRIDHIPPNRPSDAEDQ
ncbi:hypothetical protein MSSD14B_33540 [Marinobacter salsuginis]|jgi:ABC-type uncharacterized transport system substrate-binding protein|uniref:ABC transporter substrate-binding protein n=3 Tax=Marinobacteraceae TaxID=2887365 RepID=A0A5M3Q3C8_9GAMM|nr:hypothetical protein KYE_03660 [Marinobacter manganoxydans MnI7-9]GBO89686.1 hypothetical protein MSSD14B_33540 [Marinobacter salsuginis]